MRRIVVLALLAMLAALVSAAPSAASAGRAPGAGRAGGTPAKADFNGDGFSDMAVGVDPGRAERADNPIPGTDHHPERWIAQSGERS
jgi:FG-GAP repeat